MSIPELLGSLTISLAVSLNSFACLCVPKKNVIYYESFSVFAPQMPLLDPFKLKIQNWVTTTGTFFVDKFLELEKNINKLFS